MSLRAPQGRSDLILKIGHTPDADDAFLFYGLTSGKVRIPGVKIRHTLADIETLNRRAEAGRLHVTAISAAAYPSVARRYRILAVGASVGDGCGPVVVRRKLTDKQINGARNRSIPHVLGRRLKVLFCGINPSLYSGATGRHFARPANRFWRTLHEAGFTPRLFSPFEDHTLPTLGIGVTNLVNRATASADELSEEELRAGGKRLEQIARKYRPERVAVVGVGAYRKAFGRPEAKVGLQPHRINGAEIWVLPNPSGLNASYSQEDLTAAFRRLRRRIPNWRGRPGRGRIFPSPKSLRGDLRGEVVAVPGLHTTAAAVLRMFFPGCRLKPMPFHQIPQAIREGKVAAGVLIHEAQMTYKKEGLEKIADLGELWKKKTGLPLPLGLNVVRRDLPPRLQRAIAAGLAASLRYALRHRKEAMAYARRFGRGTNPKTLERFVLRYAGRSSLRMSRRKVQALRRLISHAPVDPLFPAGS